MEAGLRRPPAGRGGRGCGSASRARLGRGLGRPASAVPRPRPAPTVCLRESLPSSRGLGLAGAARLCPSCRKALSDAGLPRTKFPVGRSGCHRRPTSLELVFASQPPLSRPRHCFFQDPGSFKTKQKTVTPSMCLPRTWALGLSKSLELEEQSCCMTWDAQLRTWDNQAAKDWL